MDFIKKNFALVLGLALPILLMFGFMLSTMIPQKMEAPPKLSVLFWAHDYNNQANKNLNLNFIVEGGKLKAQYTPNPHGGYGWKKLYLYDAGTQKTREITFSVPDKADEKTTIDIAETADMKIDTSLQSPDGYELTHRSRYRNHGLFGEIFWGSGYGSNEVRLRKGSTSYPLVSDDSATPFYYGNVQFIGWVMK